MNRNKRMIFSVLWIILGILFIGLGFAGKVDAYWNGVGSSLFCVGIVQILRFRRFNKNEAYRERIEIEENDERNHFIRGKAWAWTGYICVLTACVLGIAFKIAGQDFLSSTFSYSVCFMLLVFWISYHILKRKY